MWVDKTHVTEYMILKYSELVSSKNTNLHENKSFQDTKTEWKQIWDKLSWSLIMVPVELSNTIRVTEHALMSRV